MSVQVQSAPPELRTDRGTVKIEDCRGSEGMWLTIATEATLFIMFFFAYFYLAEGGWRWLDQEAPKLPLALIMLCVLITSSVVLQWGESQLKAGRFGRARTAILITLLLGIAFLCIQYFEYSDHLKSLTPRTNVYGSIFYTITSFHAAHVIVGLLMLGYILNLPRLEPVDRPPHRPYHNVTLYWHFVDIVWVFIIAFLYVAPNIR